MTLSRRDFLKIGSLTAVAATASACQVVGQKQAQIDLPAALPPVNGRHPTIFRMLNRAGFGPRPGDMATVSQMGLAAYLEQQLYPNTIDDKPLALMERQLSLYHMDYSQIVEQDAKDAKAELITASVMRAVYSERQLYEAMVAFWSDHFNIYIGKAKFMPALKILDDREVVRPHALGNFRQLLSASARSQAMLFYLDNVNNHQGSINENYARELLELHTMGVNGGYTQRDIQEVARVLTGWGVHQDGVRKGKLRFEATQHDFGEKLILQRPFPANRGAEELDDLLDLLAAQPATAHFLATKLGRRFVSDEPPATLVDEIAQAYQTTNGDIKAMLRVLFLSDVFASAPPKLKRPFTYIVSALRALNTSVGSSRAIEPWLRQMGQLPFHWPPPDGYPDVSSAWATNLLPRWNFALALAHGHIAHAKPPLKKLVAISGATTPSAVLDLFVQLTLNGNLPSPTLPLLTNYVGAGPLTDNPTQERLKDSVAFLIASPTFQWI